MTVRQIAQKVNLSPANIMFYFPTKEHILALLVDMLCDFQWKLMKEEADDGISSLLAICLELMTMAAACEENEVARDFFVTAYQSPMCLEIIRKNDTERAKTVFAQYCEGWTDEHFVEAEILVSGTEYATLITTEEPPLDVRIAGALNNILGIYGVPEEIRKMKIEKVLAMDYRSLGKRIFKEFREYVEHTNEQAYEELLN